MNEQPTRERKTTLSTRLQKVRLSRSGSIVGMPELIALAGSALVVILVVISYLYFLVPARARLQTAQTEKTRLQGLLNSYRTEVNEEQTTETTVRDITDSLERFETEQLFTRTQGRMDLYGELNQIIRKNGLRNTAGPTYTALEPVGSKAAVASNRSANNKWQSVYPGIAISVTVEGQYGNLRRFVHDIEASRLFVIINAIELERATDTRSTGAVDGEGAPRSSLVSLRVDMATYFQRTAEEDSTGSKVSAN